LPSVPPAGGEGGAAVSSFGFASSLGAASAFGAGAVSFGGADLPDHRVHRHRLPLSVGDLQELPRRGGGDLGVDLVGGDLEEGLVTFHRVAHLLE